MKNLKKILGIGALVLTLGASTAFAENEKNHKYTAQVDLNGDGKEEVVLGFYDTEGYRLIVKETEKQKAIWGVLYLRSKPIYIHFADMDNDKDLDLVVLFTNLNKCCGSPAYVYLNDGKGNFGRMKELNSKKTDYKLPYFYNWENK